MEAHPEYLLASHLDAGERLLWHGRPRQGFKLSASDIFLIPFSLMWGGFAFFWEFMVLRDGTPWFFALWGIPFVLAGAYLIVGRFFWDIKRRSAILYAVTDWRVIIRSGVWRPSIRSVNLRTLTDLSMTERADGSGDIVLGATPPMMSWLAGSGWPGMSSYGAPVLEAVPRAREVYGIIRERQTAAA